VNVEGNCFGEQARFDRQSLAERQDEVDGQ